MVEFMTKKSVQNRQESLYKLFIKYIKYCGSIIILMLAIILIMMSSYETSKKTTVPKTTENRVGI